MPGRLNNPRLEAAYQKYSHRQRQKSVILVNVIDLGVKLAYLAVLLLQGASLSYPTIANLAITTSINIVLSLLPCYSRCYANNYLHWGAACTWLLLTVQGCYLTLALVADSFRMAWYFIFIMYCIMYCTMYYCTRYFIFIIFIMYCIMPVSLHWCLAMCLLSSVSHILTTLIKQPHGEQPSDTHNTYLMVASGNSQDAFIPSDDNNKSFVGSMPKRAQNCCIQLCD